MRYLSNIFLVTAVLISCSEEKQYGTKINSSTLIDQGYKKWEDSNIFIKSRGDTSIYITVDSSGMAVSRSIFLQDDSIYSRSASFFRSNGFIFLISDDSLKNKLVYNPKLGNLYQVVYWIKKVELVQKNSSYSIEDKF